jgi:hypothetical protein
VVVRVNITKDETATPEQVRWSISSPDGVHEAGYQHGSYYIITTGSNNHLAVLAPGTHVFELANVSGQGGGKY